MQIDDSGLILNSHGFAEDRYRLTVLSEQHGIVTGMARVVAKERHKLERGQEITFSHVRRLESQLGKLSFDITWSPLAAVLDNEIRLLTIAYLSDMLRYGLKEGDPHPQLYHISLSFLHELADRGLWRRIAFFELHVLYSLGFGLHLSSDDAVRDGEGDTSPLMYVSPKSGRVVSERAGKPYADKLCILPSVFGGVSDDFLDVFRLTGHFLKNAYDEKHLVARTALINAGIQTEFTNI